MPIYATAGVSGSLSSGMMDGGVAVARTTVPLDYQTVALRHPYACPPPGEPMTVAAMSVRCVYEREGAEACAEGDGRLQEAHKAGWRG